MPTSRRISGVKDIRLNGSGSRLHVGGVPTGATTMRHDTASEVWHARLRQRRHVRHDADPRQRRNAQRTNFAILDIGGASEDLAKVN